MNVLVLRKENDKETCIEIIKKRRGGLKRVHIGGKREAWEETESVCMN